MKTNRNTKVFRHFSLTLDNFEFIKMLQTEWSSEQNRHLNNSEVINRLLKEYAQLTHR